MSSINHTNKKNHLDLTDLTGHLLIANPKNPKDYMSESLILIVDHNDEYVQGIQINHPYSLLNLASVARGIGMYWDSDDIPDLYFGGIYGPNKVHVIHTNDWRSSTTVEITEHLSMTHDVSILSAIIEGTGPEHYRACAGYWIWEPEKIVREINGTKNSSGRKPRHRWELILPEDNLDLIFDTQSTEQWQTALIECVQQQVSSHF